MGPYLLAIDIGTSACKSALFDLTGCVAAANEKYETLYPEPGWAEQKPEDWWSSVCRAIRNLLDQHKVSAREIAGIGIAGQSWSAVAVDRNGEVLTNTPIWMDTRADSICKKISQQADKTRIFEVSGNSLQPTYTTAKIVWYKTCLPQVYQRIYKVLQSNSYIAYKLTGEMTQDISQGYGLHCFNMHKGIWDHDMCAMLGIPEGILPDIYPSHAVIGKVTARAAKETSLISGIPVVAGGLDAACGTLGAGVIRPEETQEQGGLAGGMSICTDRYIADPRLILGFHVVPGMWLLQGGTTGGGGVMRWLKQEFADSDKYSGKNKLAWMDGLAEKVAPGSDGLLFLPYMAGERSPIWNPKAKGVFYGLDFSKTKGHMIRAAMEGVAFSLRHNLDVAEQAGAKVTVLKAVGGAANSTVWTQMKADITGKPISVPSSDTATTLGAAILAGVGVGLYDSFEDAVKTTVKSERYHEPNHEYRSVYDKRYQTYLELYERLATLMEKE